LDKRDISDTGIQYLQEDITEYMALVRPHKFFEIAREYLAYDPEVKEFVAYMHSEKFPYIHKPVEYLKQYKLVSGFMCIFIKPQSDRENICSVLTFG
jgi:hypothetical protein